jgi:ankyrin repeat protein
MLVAASQSAATMNELEKAHAHVSATDQAGNTALVYAARNNRREKIVAPLDAGASSKLRNNEKVAAEDLARARGFEQIAALIEKR